MKCVVKLLIVCVVLLSHNARLDVMCQDETTENTETTSFKTVSGQTTSNPLIILTSSTLNPTITTTPTPTPTPTPTTPTTTATTTTTTPTTTTTCPPKLAESCSVVKGRDVCSTLTVNAQCIMGTCVCQCGFQQKDNNCSKYSNDDLAKPTIKASSTSSLEVTWSDFTIDTNRKFTISWERADNHCNNNDKSVQNEEEHENSLKGKTNNPPASVAKQGTDYKTQKNWINITDLTPGVSYNISVSVSGTCQGGDHWRLNYPTVSTQTDPAILGVCTFHEESVNVTFERKTDFKSCNASLDRLDETGQVVEKLPPHTFNCETLDLKPLIATGIKYILTVEVTECGVETKPRTRTIETQPTAPSSVQALNVTSVMDHYYVSWKPPVNPNGYIKSYEISMLRGSDIENDEFRSNCLFSDVTTGQIEESSADGPPSSKEGVSSGCETSIKPMLGSSDKVIGVNVSNLTPDGFYTVFVTAVNQECHGESANKTFAATAYVPHEPNNFKGEVESNSDINLTWEPPAVYPGHTNYTIKVTRDGHENVINVIGYTNTSYAVSGLKSSTVYVFTIMTRTSAGDSPETEPKSIRTLDERPEQVQNLTAPDKTANSILIQWKQPLHINGRGNLTAYVIYVRPSDDEDTHTCYRVKAIVYSENDFHHTFMVTDRKSKTGFCQIPVDSAIQSETRSLSELETVNVTNLEPYIQYAIMVTAYNTFGPGEPLRITQTTSIGVGKTVDQVNKQADDQPTVPQSLNDTMGVIFVGVAQVFGINNIDCCLGVPSEPRNLTGTVRSNSEITLTWDPPPINPGPTTYIIRVKRNDSMTTDAEKTISVVGYTSKSYLVRGLNSSTVYVFAIMAMTTSGNSSETVSEPKLTWNERPDKVQDLSVINKTASIIIIQWGKPVRINGHGNLIAFVVYVRRNDTGTDRCTAVKAIVYKKDAFHLNKHERFCKLPAEKNITIETNMPMTTDLITLSVTNLDPYVKYDIVVAAYNSFGPGEPFWITNRTYSGTPFPPTGIRCVYLGHNNMQIKWNPPVNYTGPTTYDVFVQESKLPRDTSEGYINRRQFYGTDKTYIENQNITIKSYWTYSVHITPETSAGKGETTNAYCYTPSAAPGHVHNFNVRPVPRNVSVASVTWECPTVEDRHGVLETFVIDVKSQEESPQTHNYDISNKDQSVMCGKSFNKQIPITPEVLYTFQIRAKAVNVTQLGDPKFANFSTTISKPPPLKSVLSRVNDTGLQTPKIDKETSIVFHLTCLPCLLNASNGDILFTGVLVCPDASCREAPSQDSQGRTWKQAHAEDFRVSYVSTGKDWKNVLKESQVDTLKYTVGEDKSCPKMSETNRCNGPLPSNRKFWVKVYSCTKAGCRYSDASGPFVTAAHKESDNIATIAGAVSGILAVATVIIIVIVIIRKRRGRESKNHSERPYGTMQNGISLPIPLQQLKPEIENWASEKRPITIGEFESNLNKLRMYEKVLLNREFSELTNCSPKHETEHGLNPDNKPDNRWTNILPFDHCRVKLSVDDKSEVDRPHDYINASFIPGVKIPKRYIATQGPLHKTVGDFWRMVWEQDVCVIVMLSQFEEMDPRSGLMKEKVARYFPDEEESKGYQYDNITVNRTGKMDSTIWEIRTLKLCDVLTKKCRFVKHFLFKSWTDHEADIRPTHLIEFVNLVRQETSKSSRPEAPLVVHCSAGVGRTGTFLVVDYLNEDLENVALNASSETDFYQGKVDIFGTVLNMRNYRKMLVQTKAQYSFIYEAVLTLIQQKAKYLHGDDDIYYNIDDEDYENNDEMIYANAEVFSGALPNNDNNNSNDVVDNGNAGENVSQNSVINRINSQGGDESEYDDVEDLRMNMRQSKRL